MNRVTECGQIDQVLDDYVSARLSPERMRDFTHHLRSCSCCSAKVQRFREVQNLMQLAVASGQTSEMAGRTRLFVETENSEAAVLYSDGITAESRDAKTARLEFSGWLGTAPWWMVSCCLHFLIIVLTSLISMTIEMPNSDDAVIMITELQRRTEVKDSRKEVTPENLRDVLATKKNTTLDINSVEASNIVIPPDITAQAEVGDHFETINPELPDSHSAYGTEESHSFHSIEGNAEPAGGGGMGSVGSEDVIGVGGSACTGSGGGWGGGTGTGIGTGIGAGKGSFGQRSGGGKRLMIKRHGGSAATESAVDKALEWLAYHQEPDGHWDTKKYGASAKQDTALTSLATLAFLGAGHTERVGQWKDNVQRAIGWLRNQQSPDGLVFAKGDAVAGGGDIKYGPGPSYHTAMATMALAEAAGMANIKATREAAQKAVDYCTEIHQQGEGSDKGAWRYNKKAYPDISNGGWFVMALKSAKVAGLHVNPASFEGAVKFLDKVEVKANVPDNGYGPASRYKYMQDQGSGDCGPRRTAIGLLCRQFLGWKKEELESSVELFVKEGGTPNWPANPAKPNMGIFSKGEVDLYYWYYGTLCVFQQGGDTWKLWNDALKKALVPTQCAKGDESGSWDPTGEWSDYWGRVGQTALGCLSLEVYYRYQRLQADN